MKTSIYKKARLALIIVITLIAFLALFSVLQDLSEVRAFEQSFANPLEVVYLEMGGACSDWSWVPQVKAKLPPKVLWDNKIYIGATMQGNGKSGYGNFTVQNQVMWIGLTPKEYVVITDIHLRADLNCELARVFLTKELVGTAFAKSFMLNNRDFVLSGPYENLVFVDGLGALYLFEEWDGISRPTCDQLRVIDQLSTSGYFPKLFSPQGFSILPGGITNILAVHCS